MKTLDIISPRSEGIAKNDVLKSSDQLKNIQRIDLVDNWLDCPSILQQSNSDYIAFIDTEFEGWEKLLTQSVELLSTAKADIYYPKDNLFNINNKTQSPTAYFCIIRRAILSKYLSKILEYQNITYGLLHLGAYLEKNKVQYLDEVDSTSWITKQLHKNIQSFKSDFESFRNIGLPYKNIIPPQFVITSSDYFVQIDRNTESTGKSTFFSIICPVFKPQFLEEMIQSVLDQKWTKWELWLGVDGPKKENEFQILETISRFSDERIHFFTQENQGTGPTREKLRKRASGDFIISIDDDDKLTELTLAVFAKAIVSNPTIKSFRGGSQIFGLASQQLLPKPRYQINGISNDAFEVNQPYAIKRELLEEVGGYHWDVDLHNAGEDTYLFHEFDRLNIPTGLIPLPLYFRRLSTENLTLEFEGDEAMAHFNNLDQKYAVENWTITDRKFDFEGNFQLYSATYQNKNQKLFLATKFFQYQTLGDLNQLTIDLEVTSRCNAVCGFCPRDAMPDTNTHISMESVQKVADYVKQFPGTQVVLCGIGESLLHPKLVEIVTLLKGSGATVAMTSNGALMRLEKFKALVAAGLTNFNFSINAHSPEVHKEVMGMKNYKKVFQNITGLLAYRSKHFPEIRVHASCVVCKQNEHEIESFVKFWKSQNVSQVWLHPINNRAGLLGANLKSGEIKHFAEVYKSDSDVSVDIFKDHDEGEKLCKIAKSLAFISSKGDMHLCAMDYQRKISHGNIRTKSLQQMQFEKLKNCMTGTYDEFCSSCDFCPSGIKNKVNNNLITI
ncbi:MAG: MoaA/NifB/PqqE/SkfB family radical SAM enzyme [Crocinitomix sp.]|jgi:MoaA/NifB/PqqE/SkfB family radical SAM enzyme/glycosyltransferase involved in cell wall biosynthesis